MRLRISKLHEIAKDRPEGYVLDVICQGKIDGEWLEISEEAVRGLREKYRPPPAPVEPPLPSFPDRALNYGKAVVKDVMAGRPRRTPEERERIVEEICTPCEWFRPSDQTCAKCGCPLSKKTPMAREHCPIGKW